MRLAALLAVLTVARCAWTWWAHGYTMEPDFSLYTKGGIGLFPSPLGRLLGAFGPDVFAAVSVLASGLVVLLVALLARRHGRSPGLAAALAALMPATLYLGYAGIDPIGLALLLAALVWARPSLAALAALAHLSLAPFALLLLPRASWPARLVLGVFVAVLTGCLLLTPYSGIVYGLFALDGLYAAAQGLLALLLIAAPVLLLRPTVERLVVWAVAIGLGECLLQQHLQARYLLPAAFLLAASARGWAPATPLVRPRSLRLVHLYSDPDR